MRDRVVPSAVTNRWAAPGASGVRRHSPIRSLSGFVLVVLAFGVFALGGITAVYQLRLSPVLSGSMRPGIQPGDLVVTKALPITALKAGDVISFFPPDSEQAVLHRLQSVVRREDGTWITTKGDANDVADPWGEIRLRSDRAWRLVTTVPVVGFIPIWTQSLRGPLLVVAGVVLAISGALAFWRSGLLMHPSAARGH